MKLFGLRKGSRHTAAQRLKKILAADRSSVEGSTLDKICEGLKALLLAELPSSQDAVVTSRSTRENKSTVLSFTVTIP